MAERPAAALPEGVADWLEQLGLSDRTEEVARWCNEQGASCLEEVVYSLKDVV